MQININQKKISIRDKYQIYIDGQQTHFASRQLFRLMPVIHLYTLGNEKARMTIKRRFSFKARYDIYRWDNNIFKFKTISFWKLHYHCLCGKDMYDIYGHRGRKYSVYKNNFQIAWWDKKPVSWFAGDNYTITANKDSDVDLLISFCLIIDNYRSDNHDRKSVTYDVGHIGWQAKKFDNLWQPKD